VKKAGIVHNRDLLAQMPDAIQCYIDAAYKSFHYVKKEPLQRDTWITGLIAAQAEHSQKSKCALWKQL